MLGFLVRRKRCAFLRGVCCHRVFCRILIIASNVCCCSGKSGGKVRSNPAPSSFPHRGSSRPDPSSFSSAAEGVFTFRCQSSWLQWPHLHTQLCWYEKRHHLNCVNKHSVPPCYSSFFLCHVVVLLSRSLCLLDIHKWWVVFRLHHHYQFVGVVCTRTIPMSDKLYWGQQIHKASLMRLLKRKA